MEDKNPKIELNDYMLAYAADGQQLVIESVVQKLDYYEAYIRALEKLKNHHDIEGNAI